MAKSSNKRRLKIASYNINGINTRLHVLLRWLEEFQPDIVGLQELKALDEAFPAKDIEALGYSAIWHGQKSWNGVAILSRVGEPVETGRGLPGDPDDEQSRYIEAAVSGLLIGNAAPLSGPNVDFTRPSRSSVCQANARPNGTKSGSDCWNVASNRAGPRSSSTIIPELHP